MFDYIYEWIQNIAFYLVLVTAVLHAVPDKDYKKYIRFFTGLVLILMLLTPVLKVFGTEIRITDFTLEGRSDYESLLQDFPVADDLEEEYEERFSDGVISEGQETGGQTSDGQTADGQAGGEEKAGEIEVEEIQIDW